MDDTGDKLFLAAMQKNCQKSSARNFLKFNNMSCTKFFLCRNMLKNPIEQHLSAFEKFSYYICLPNTIRINATLDSEGFQNGNKKSFIRSN